MMSRRTLLVGAALAAGATALPSRPARAASTLRFGTIKSSHQAATWIIPDFVPKGVDIRLVEFKTSLELISAQTAGAIDIGNIGYWHFVRLLDQGTAVTAVAGVSSGGSRLVVRKASAIHAWADLKGKTCAAARGSTQDIQFLLALKNKGLSIQDITYRDLGGNMAAFISALQQGQVDAASMWEPFASQVVEQNVAESFSTMYDDSFRVNSLLYGDSAFLEKNRDLVQTFVAAHVKATERLLKNAGEYLELGVKLTGFPRETMQLANKNSFPEYMLRLDDARKLAAAVLDLKYTKTDVRPKLEGAFDYRYLTQATGKGPKELGA
jgi:sulfonate transport system substrate-binding protein